MDHTFWFSQRPQPSMFSLARAFYQALFFQNRDVVGLDRGAGLAQLCREVVVCLGAGGQLLEDERPGFIAV